MLLFRVWRKGVAPARMLQNAHPSPAQIPLAMSCHHMHTSTHIPTTKFKCNGRRRRSFRQERTHALRYMLQLGSYFRSVLCGFTKASKDVPWPCCINPYMLSTIVIDSSVAWLALVVYDLVLRRATSVLHNSCCNCASTP